MDIKRSRTVGAALAASAMALSGALWGSAGVAQAAGNGLDVRFVPVLQGMQVTITDLVGAGKQNCSYDAVPQNSLLPPTRIDFVLGVEGENMMVIPGLPTGTTWEVNVSCSFDPPNPFAIPGSWNSFQTY